MTDWLAAEIAARQAERATRPGYDETQASAVLITCAKCGRERFHTHPSDLCWLCRQPPIDPGFTKRAIKAPETQA